MKHIKQLATFVGIAALSLGLVGQTLAGGGGEHSSNNNKCMKIDRPDLVKNRDLFDIVSLRDEFTREYLLDLAKKLIHDRTVNQNCMVDLPAISWTGQTPIPSLTNIPRETVNIKNLTPDQLAEKLLSLALLETIEVDNNQAFVLSNDLLGVLKEGPYKRGRGKYLRSFSDLMEGLFNQAQAGTIILNDARLIGLGLGVTHLRNLADIYDYPNNAFENYFSQTYSVHIHRYYNQLQNFDIAGYGRMSNGDYTYGASFAPFPNFLELTPEHSKVRVADMQLEALAKEKILQWEKEAVGKYFWPRLFVDGQNSMLYTFNGADPDGYTRPNDTTIENYVLPGQVMSFEYLTQLSAPFTSLSVIAPSFLLPTLTYESVPEAGITGIKQMVLDENPGNAEAANKILKAMEKIWNKDIAPKYAKLAKIAAVRIAESEDDFYPGSWRVKIKNVISVQHDADNVRAISATVKLTDGKTYTVPLNGTAGASKKIRQIQADIAEMDKWFENNLAVAQNLRSGDKFSLLYKKDPTRGICGGTATGTVPYASEEDLTNNFRAEERIVDQDGVTLSDLVYQSGNSGSKFFYDIKEFLADRYVKLNFALYNFADATSAGVCKTNLNGEFISYNRVRDDLNAQLKGSFANSDVSVLGRHYGYNANGSRKDDEWLSETELKYTYQEFDYIYRQHFAVDDNAPLASSNIIDPQTGKQLYQYSDPGDETRLNAFLDRFSALEALTTSDILSNKPGTYFRWKQDWVFQKISGFVIANAVSKNLLKAPFVEQYYSTTFQDSNDPTSTACGFGLQKGPTETVNFRLLGQTGGSANSGQYIDIDSKLFIIQVRFNTLNPTKERVIAHNISIFLHEGALGHGFDQVPNVIDLFRGTENEVSWLSNLNAGLVTTELPQVYYPMTGPAYAALAEGWATYGEINGVTKALNVLFDPNGCPNAARPNHAGNFLAMSDLSRIAARQVSSIGINSSKYAWSFYHMDGEFKRLTDLIGIDASQFSLRFIAHPTQQTTYATGFITNIGLVGYIKDQAALRGPNCDIDEAAFNELRITRTDYIIGALLQKFIDANLDSLIKCE